MLQVVSLAKLVSNNNSNNNNDNNNNINDNNDNNNFFSKNQCCESFKVFLVCSATKINFFVSIEVQMN